LSRDAQGAILLGDGHRKTSTPGRLPLARREPGARHGDAGHPGARPGAARGVGQRPPGSSV